VADDEQQILVAISFPDQFRANEFLTASARLAHDGHLRVQDAVFIAKDAEGKTHVRETTDPQAGPTALTTGMWAGLFGLLLGGPVGFLIAGGIGAAGGAVTAKVVDLGIPDEWVHWLREAVAPGTTTLALLVTHVDVEAVLEELKRFEGARLVYGNLPQAVLDRVRDALGEPQPAPEPAPPDAAPSEPSPTSEPSEPSVPPV
jgi:uncharacterized membrane protein